MKGYYSKSLPSEEDGYVFSKQEWVEMVRCGTFIPDDGSGYWATDKGYDRTLPVFHGQMPEDATHVVWYNK